jgi:hypothetical protein
MVMKLLSLLRSSHKNEKLKTKAEERRRRRGRSKEGLDLNSFLYNGNLNEL